MQVVTAFFAYTHLGNGLVCSVLRQAPESVFSKHSNRLDRNLKSAFLTCKYVLPVMEQQGYGAIINISSVAGLRCGVGRHMISYHASKAGLIQFTRSVAIQYAKKGIRANCVVPSIMKHLW